MKVAHDYAICDHRSHQIVLNDDGSVETPDHPDAAAQGRRMAAFARLGRPVPLEGCSTVAALAYAADVLCDCDDSALAPAAWRGALRTYWDSRVVTFAIQTARARKKLLNERTAARLMAELSKVPWFRGQQIEIRGGLTNAEVREWGVVADSGASKIRLPIQSYWIDLAENGRVVYGDKLIVGDDKDDPRVVYAVYRDSDAEVPVYKVGAFRRDTRMERLERE